VAKSDAGRIAPLPPTPGIFVSADSKGFSNPVSSLFATLTGEFVSVGSKGFTGVDCLQESNRVGREDFAGVRRTAWRGRMVRRARKNRADLTNRYSISVPYVNDYL
jgi:hypothetical protein